MVRPRCASRAASLYVATLLLTAAAQAILLQEEASYSELHQLPGSQTQNAPSSQNDQERRMRLFYVERKSLSNTSVLCNDGTAAGYYIRKSEKSSNWLIFLEGGSYCFDQVSCAERRTHDQRLISSSNWPANRRALGIVSGDRTENPLFANETVVLVPYCSSDLWSGNSMSRSNVSDFYFMGSIIVKELVKQLLATENMGRANRIMLAGSSAGGIGALLNFQNVKSLVESHARRHRVHPAPQLRTFADSSWFLNIIEEDLRKMDRLLPAGTRPPRRKPQKASKLLLNDTATVSNARRPPALTTTVRTSTVRKKKEPCNGLMGCQFALQETIKIASSVWQSDPPHECTRLASNENKPWRCFYPFVLLRSMQKSKNPIPVFILQNVYDRVQMQMDSGFGHQRLGPSYLEALRDKMHTTLEKTKGLFVGIFAPACYGHELSNRFDWSKLVIGNSTVVEALQCWEQRLDMRNQRVLNTLARRTSNLNGNAAAERGFWTIFRTVNSKEDPAMPTSSTAEPRCSSRLLEVDKYPLNNARCPTVHTQSAYRRAVDRIDILREFGYSDAQINRVLNLTDRSRLITATPRRRGARQFRFPARIPRP